MAEHKGDVMIVDDDAHVRIAVKTILSDAGFHIISADSGGQCIDLLKKRIFRSRTSRYHDAGDGWVGYYPVNS